MLRSAAGLIGALLALTALGAAAAEPAAGVAGLVERARAAGLASDPYWLALLHYRPRALGGVRSEIISPEFFLAPSGPADPDAELAATLAALFEAPGGNPDAHAQCRFVARYKWLRRKLDWGTPQAPRVDCPQYRAYSFNGQVESLSLVYATGYLSNPASFYGHILLKFNVRRSVVATDLLDESLNFGAVVPAHENGVLYALRGLFGGYDAAFSRQQFYNFNHAYAENELRDLWEYRLALAPDEVDQLVAHSWELLGKKYVYYFLKENCGYRMAELLGLVLREPLLPDLPYALPGTVFERIAGISRDGVPLVREVRRIPSRQNRYRESFLAMSEAERQASLALAGGKLDLRSDAYSGLPVPDKVRVVDTLLDYYEYRIVSDKQDQQARRAKQALLLERIALPAQAGSEAEIFQAARAAPPHEGPLPFLLRPEALHNNRLGDGLSLRLRPANYDRLALDTARIPHSQLTMFDVKLAYLDHRLRLRSLDFFDVENLNVAATPLPGDGGIAWKLRLGLQSRDLECSGCTTLRGQGGFGKAVPLARQAVGFAMLDGFVQAGHADPGTLAAVPRLGVIASPAPAWKSYLSVGRQTYLNGSHDHQRVVLWENRFGSDRRWDLRLGYEENAARELSAGISFYW